MNERDAKRQFVALLMPMAELAGKDFSAGAIDVFWAAVRKYPIEAILQAMRIHQQQTHYMVQVADIVRIIEGSPGANATKAWGVAIQAIDDHGPYSSVVFADPLITACIVARWGEQGWERFCNMSADEEPFVRKDFILDYERFSREGPPTGYPTKLVGILERQNRGRFELNECTAPTAHIGEGAQRLLEAAPDRSGEVIRRLKGKR